MLLFAPPVNTIIERHKGYYYVMVPLCCLQHRTTTAAACSCSKMHERLATSCSVFCGWNNGPSGPMFFLLIGPHKRRDIHKQGPYEYLYHGIYEIIRFTVYYFVLRRIDILLLLYCCLHNSSITRIIVVFSILCEMKLRSAGTVLLLSMIVDK